MASAFRPLRGRSRCMFEWLGCDRHCSALVLKTLDNVPRISVQSSETYQFAGSGGARQSCATSGGHRNAISKSAGRSGQSCLDERAGKWTFQQPHTQRHQQTVVQTVSLCELRHGQIRQTRPHAVGLSSLGGRRLLCCRGPRPLHISEIPSPAFLGWGLGSPPSPILWIRKSHDFRSELALLR